MCSASASDFDLQGMFPRQCLKLHSVVHIKLYIQYDKKGGDLKVQGLMEAAGS